MSALRMLFGMTGAADCYAACIIAMHSFMRHMHSYIHK